MDVMTSSPVTDVSCLQPAKAPLGILVAPAGIAKVFNLDEHQHDLEYLKPAQFDGQEIGANGGIEGGVAGVTLIGDTGGAGGMTRGPPAKRALRAWA